MRPIAWPEQRSYIDAFDGLRAIAVLLVVWHHTLGVLQPTALGLLTPVARVGWVGVDVFFTLSGFLITGILLRTRDHPRYFKNFYIRRLLRIFPLYYGVLTLIYLPRALVGVPTEVPWWAAYGYLSNFWVAVLDPDDLAIVVTWSLSIEEQFYAVWPLAVLALPRRWLWRVLVGAALVAPGLRAWLHDPANEVSYMWTFCRMDALGIGAVGALLWHGRRERWVRAAQRLGGAGVVGFLALIASGWMDTHDRSWAVPGYTLVALCVVVVVLALASDPDHPLRRPLVWAPLRHVGKVSYGVYLLHPLVIGGLLALWAPLGLPDPSEDLGAALLAYGGTPVLSVAVATLVFRTIEAPILSLKDRWAPYREAAPSGQTDDGPEGSGTGERSGDR